MNPVENTKPLLTSFQYNLETTGSLKITADINGLVKIPQVGFDEYKLVIYVESASNDCSEVYRIDNLLHTYEEPDASFDVSINTNLLNESILEINLKSSNGFANTLKREVLVIQYVDSLPKIQGLYTILKEPFGYPIGAYFFPKEGAFYISESNPNQFSDKVEHKVYYPYDKYAIPVNHVK